MFVLQDQNDKFSSKESASYIFLFISPLYTLSN